MLAEAIRLSLQEEEQRRDDTVDTMENTEVEMSSNEEELSPESQPAVNNDDNIQQHITPISSPIDVSSLNETSTTNIDQLNEQNTECENMEHIVVENGSDQEVQTLTNISSDNRTSQKPMPPVPRHRAPLRDSKHFPNYHQEGSVAESSHHSPLPMIPSKELHTNKHNGNDLSSSTKQLDISEVVHKNEMPLYSVTNDVDTNNKQTIEDHSSIIPGDTNRIKDSVEASSDSQNPFLTPTAEEDIRLE